MRTGNLTAKAVEKMGPDPNKRVEVPDGIVPGLYLLVTPRGSKSWTVRYRHQGRPRKLTLGRFPLLSLAKAREKAREALEKVQAGEDPAGVRLPTRTAPGTVAQAIERYIEEHCKPNTRCWQETDRLFRLHVIPPIGDLALRSLGKWEIRDLIREVVEAGKPVQANRVLAAIKAMLNWAVTEDLLDANPAQAVKKPTREYERTRTLTDGELWAVMAVCDDLGYPAGPLIKLLALTGQRRDEVRCMRWSEIDLDNAVWAVPAGRVKNRQNHIVPLSTTVNDLLERLPRFEGGFVFTADGSRPYSNLIKPKRSLDKRAGVTDWTLHDLRRTVATGMGHLGIPGETIARVLNHSERAISGVTARYNVAEYTEAKRRALDAWSQHVAGLAPDNVIVLNA